jgi:hypothetical protein
MKEGYIAYTSAIIIDVAIILEYSSNNSQVHLGQLWLFPLPLNPSTEKHPLCLEALNKHFWPYPACQKHPLICATLIKHTRKLWLFPASHLPGIICQKKQPLS